MRFYDVNILPYIILACIYVYVYVLIDTTASITRGVLIQKGLPGTFDVLVGMRTSPAGTRTCISEKHAFCQHFSPQGCSLFLLIPGTKARF